MKDSIKTPVHRTDDGELMGYIQEVDDLWQAQTIFGYPFLAAATQEDATNIVLDKGLAILMDTWEYHDQASGEWERCIIIEAAKDSVTVAPMDGLLPDTVHTHTLTGPFENNLRKA